MTATADHVLAILDFALPCESADGCPFESAAEWVLSGTAPACGHRLSMLLCDYCRIAFQEWCLHELRHGGTFACGDCGAPLGRPVGEVYRLTPLRGKP